jgi:hypothetical protein
MLDPKLSEKIAYAYKTIGEIGYSISLNFRKGKDHSFKQKELFDRGKKLRLILKILGRHVDTETTPPTLYRITEGQVNRLVMCMEKIGRFDTFPIFPSALPKPKPIIVRAGQDGANGNNGINGTDADIIVEPDDGETEITVDTEIIGGIKHYKIGYTKYEEPTISVDISGSKVNEIGTVVSSHNFTITTRKGSKAITGISIVNPASLNAALQAILDFNTLNGVSQPTSNFVVNTNISVDITYSATVTDGENTNSSNVSINFYYPFLFGSTSGTSITYYTALTKLIASKSNKSVQFNGTGQYFWLGYPESYGSLARIKDQNGFVVTGAFTEITVTVNSSGLANNWSQSYKFYRTTLPTDINNAFFTFEF